MLDNQAIQPTVNGDEINIKQLEGFQDVTGFFTLMNKIEKREFQQVASSENKVEKENDRYCNPDAPKIQS